MANNKKPKRNKQQPANADKQTQRSRVAQPQESAPSGYAAADENYERATKPPWYKDPNLVTAIGTGLLGIIGIGSLIFTGESILITRDNFRQDQRPFIWLSDKNEPPAGPQLAAFQQQDGTTANYLVWNIHYSNYGKTPARGATMAVGMAAGNVPRQAINAPVRFDEEKRLPPIPPNKDDFTTVTLRDRITEPQFRELMGLDEAIVARLLIKYSDSSGLKYETRICVTHLRSGAMEYCGAKGENYIR